MKKKYLILVSLLVGAFQLTAQSPHFFGVTTTGSGSNAGTIFRTDTNGTNVSVIDTFDVSTNGASPFNQELLEVSGKMYGVTSKGGENGNGVFFEFDPVSGNYTVRHHFNDSTGNYSYCYLLLGSNGRIYGTASQGGSAGLGTLFEYNTTTNSLIKKVSFNSTTTGSYPRGRMVETATGVFYGVCQSGGANSRGTIFKYTVATNTIEIKDDFDNAGNGRNPSGGLMKASSGILYGMTQYGGANNFGTLFQYNLTADSIKALVQFNRLNGRSGQGTVIERGGYLYGLTFFGNYTTSSSGRGLLFRYDIANDTIIRVRAFATTFPGYYPTGDLVPGSSADKFLIIMSTGGANNFAGAISEYTLSTNAIVNRASFDRYVNGYSPKGNLKKSSVNGKYYGIANRGGSGDFGTLFEFDPASDTIINKHNFSPSNKGKRPRGTLVKAPNGLLYGVTELGGVTGSGTIFEVNPVTNDVVKKADFNASVGSGPIGLTLATNGKLYGVTVGGGLYNNGALFEYNLTTNVLIKLKDIYSVGTYPRGGLIQATNGKLYGTTTNGGSNNRGVVYSYDITLDSLQMQDDFKTSIEGSYPNAKLMQATNGKLYGTTNRGGTNDRGTVFEFDINADSIKSLASFNDTNGSYPQAGLMQASNGKMYGVTTRGNSSGFSSINYGVVYEFDFISDTIINKADFDRIATGYGGYGELLEASNSKLYITAGYNLGNVASLNEFNPITNTFISKSLVPGQTLGSLIELVSPNNASIKEGSSSISHLKVYPNPTNSILTIDTKGKVITAIKIMTISGQLVQSKLNNNNTIDVSNYTNGLYIIQIETKNGIALSRFIKN